MKTPAVREKILNLIESQRQNGKDRLPPERSLAASFGCSRSTIVKILCDLEVEGVIFRKGGSGTYLRAAPEKQGLRIGILMRHVYQASDEHFCSILDALSECASNTGIQLQIFDNLKETDSQGYERCPPVLAFQHHEVDGFLLISRLPLSFVGFLAKTAPAVSINNLFGDGQEIPGVTCDYFRAGFLAGRYLLALNHRRIAYLTEDCNHPETFRELSGFQSALETAGITLHQADILETKQMPGIFARRCADFFRKNNYTACFLRNLNLVRPLLACFKSWKINVPEDISIIAAGDYSHLRIRNPGITVVDTRIRDICREALEVLVSLIQNKKNEKPAAFRLLEPRIIERCSVKKKEEK